MYSQVSTRLSKQSGRQRARTTRSLRVLRIHGPKSVTLICKTIGLSISEIQRFRFQKHLEYQVEWIHNHTSQFVTYQIA